MKIQRIRLDFSICQIAQMPAEPSSGAFLFAAKTDEEISLLCPTREAPEDAIKREDGWRAFRIAGVLDFSLIGILAQISTLLAREGIGIFAVSTYNTDYIFVKAERYEEALEALARDGYDIED